MDVTFAHTLHIAMSEGAKGEPTSSDADQDVTPRICTCTTRRHILDNPVSEGLIFLVLVLLIIIVDASSVRLMIRGYFPSAWSGSTVGACRMTRLVGILTLESEKRVVTILT